MKIVSYSPPYRNQVIQIAQQIHATSVYADLPLDEDWLIANLNSYGNNPATYFSLVMRDEEVYGGFLGSVSRTFFCKELLARDMGWWVKPEKRGSGAAILLLRDFERWSREKGARKIMIGQTGVVDIEKTTQLFIHCGYTPIGFNCVKDL